MSFIDFLNSLGVPTIKDVIRVARTLPLGTEENLFPENIGPGVSSNFPVEAPEFFSDGKNFNISARS